MLRTKVYPGAAKVLVEAQKKAVAQVAEQLLAEIIDAQVIPLDTGNLQNVQTYVEPERVDEGEVSIVHETPYAAKLYYHPEYNFDKTFNPNAKGLWWDDYINGDKKDRAKELFTHFYRKLSGRFVK